MVQENLTGLNYLKSLSYWSGGGDFDTKRIAKLLDCLENPQDKVKTIHIAGTNGKGSVSCMISSILGEDGFKVGLNISPHLVRLNERIVLNGKEIEDSELEWAGEKIREASIATSIIISFHEALTTAAFLIFERQKVDYAVIEVGLGGRLDSTNVIKKPEVVSVVTIDFDHTHILGETLAKIAYEKACIIKENSKVVVGALPEEALEVVNKYASLKNAQLFNINKDFSLKSISFEEFIYLEANKQVKVRPALKGTHQHHNAAIAFKICTELGVDDQICKKGIETAFWPARLETIGPVASKSGTNIIFDCAHNPAGVYVVTRYLEEFLKAKVQLVFGVLQTKDWHKMVDMLVPFADEIVLLKPNSERALPIEELKSYLKSNGYSFSYAGENYTTVKDLIFNNSLNTLVVGSMYMVGALREIVAPGQLKYWNSN